MTRCLNTKCDFKHGFFLWGKHTLKEDRDQRIERYRTWAECNNDPRQVFNTLTASDISDSGAWLPTPEHDYRPKLFDDLGTQTLAKKICPHWNQPQWLFSM